MAPQLGRSNQGAQVMRWEAQTVGLLLADSPQGQARERASHDV